MSPVQRKPGRVTLVGAGPGDPDLLTLAAVKAIASADVILVDDLVHPAVLAHAAAAARVVYVGKRGPYCRSGQAAGARRPSTPQAFIERLMRVEAKRGRHVVRLKGGDPYVFGRGGEERAYLLAHGIDVDVVPGVSSGLAGPAAIGIPATHRDWSQGVVLVTGHRRRGGAAGRAGGADVDGATDGGAADAAAAEGGAADAGASDAGAAKGGVADAGVADGGASDGGAFAPDVDWGAVAATGLTIVVYMGVGRCREIVDALVAGGLSPDTPAAAVQSAWTAQQRQVVGTLGTLVDDVRAAAIGSPAILVVGNVVRCADQRWVRVAAGAEAAAG